MRGLLLALFAALAPISLAAHETPPAPTLAAALAPASEDKSTSVASTRDTGWAFETSDIPVDPDYRFSTLANGVRVIVRHNALPAGTAIVRMLVATGSLDETEAEQGYAHFIEHMAFNGSRRVPEGQMVPLLERAGLAFGADTNASTGFERTVYKLDLPTNDPKLLDTALMLMRETASELTIAPEAVTRERGVILSEMRDRNSFDYRNTVASTQFLYPEARFARRFPIGLTETLDKADAASLRAFYAREYVPSHVTLIVVGDYDAAAIEAAITRHFNDWQASAQRPEPQPGAGPIARKDKGRTAIYLDPALSERITAVRSGKYLNEPDSVATRQEKLLRTIGYAIVNRRLQSLSRSASPPFRGAGFGTGDVFEAGRATRLIVDSIDRKWREGLAAALGEYRKALKRGFTEAEVAEQVAAIRAQLVDAAGAADTRSNASLVAGALALVTEQQVPSTPDTVLARFKAFAPYITPEAVLKAMSEEAVPLKDPLLRFEGRYAPQGGKDALRNAWRDAMRAPLPEADTRTTEAFAYTDFGRAGSVVSDHVERQLGIREVRFANNVMLNLRRTSLEKDKVRVQVSIDGGDMLDTAENPAATEMASYLPLGGLGKHSRDALDTILAGRTLGFAFESDPASFKSSAQTTPRDLELQLELLAALVTDPGYRLEGEVQYRQAVNNSFAKLHATPGAALQADLGRILSDGDPRFSLQPVQTYRELTFAKLREDIADRLAHGAIEIAVVGDIDEDQVIAEVARTFGALPEREAAFRDHSEQPARTFTQDRSPRVLRHDGPADQALLRMTWPTRDDSDPTEALALELLERVMRVELTDELREALGKAYSPSAASSLSRHWKDYGLFSVTASLDVADVPAARRAIRSVVESLRAAPVDADTLARARQPILEALQNGLKTNSGWMSLVDRAQSEPGRIARYLAATGRLEKLTALDVRSEALRYLDPDAALEITVLPREAQVP